MFRSQIVLALVLGLLASPATTFAQEEKPEKAPEQVLVEDQRSYEHKDSPQFLFRIPNKKKKYAELRDKWRFVDLAVLQERELARVAKALEEAEAKDPRDEERIGELTYRKRQIEQRYQQQKMRLEVQGKPDESVDVWVTSVDKGAQIADVGPRKFAAQNWSSVEYLVEREVTSKRLKKAGGAAHHFEFTGTEKESQKKYFYRMDIYLVLSKDGKTKVRVMYMHRFPSRELDKASRKRAQLVFSCLRVAGV